jgi:sortase family protein
MYSRRGKRRLALAYLLGVASLLAVEGIVAGVLSWPPTTSVAGSPHAVAATTEPATPAPEPAAAAPTDTPPSPPPPARPAPESPASAPVVPAQEVNTVRLPDGGVAHLVRQAVVDGVLPVPQQLNQAAWWGADLNAPQGATVFAGHVNWGGRTGPFAGLWTTKIGQEVTVVDGSGAAVTYRVSQLFSLQKDELPQRAADLFAQTGPHRIVLVTCGGEWVGGEQGYAENRVVIADPA